MGTIVCAKCLKVIDYFDHNKVTKIYSNHCDCCYNKSKEKNPSA
ncbi:GapA-binding peptide SR1P [Tenuibacillus multivorans]|uniref:SR1 protein n=1 Tax=Tenuibacillus multivorans TaxID=237069 RepID=A0A1G9YD44_9BACI|nr:GapA-binding peptide SR1P [Tenuibacillus multivorans]GEL76029.1 hypothetical protein TMU01_02640 [Tenuibacillus multivorans]SDN06431.1 SR1 protein [Tenuibacillus multivorans]